MRIGIGLLISSALIFLVLVVIPLAVILVTTDVTANDKLVAVQLFSSSLFTLFAICISASAVYYSRLDRDDDIERSHTDGFWFRTVLFPQFYDSLQRLIDKYKEIFEKSPGQIDLEEFSSNVFKLQSATNHFEIVDEKFVTDMHVNIDFLQSHVSVEVNLAKGEDLGEVLREDEMNFDDFTSKVLSDLYSLHKNLSIDS